MIPTNHMLYRLGMGTLAAGLVGVETGLGPWRAIAAPKSTASTQPTKTSQASPPKPNSPKPTAPKPTAPKPNSPKATESKPVVPPSKPSKVTQKSSFVVSDPVVIPGQKIGPITPKTNYQDLVKIFGEKSLADIRPPDADDTEKEHGTRVDLGPEYSLTLVWLDETKTRLYEAIDLGPGWKMPLGLTVGMPMAEVEKKLGPFNMVGLGGPYGGVVILTDTLAQKHYGKMILQLTASPGADKKSPQQYKGVEGERLIPSSDPNWKAMGMSVKYLVIIFPRV